jgi:hypothetical protein
LRTAAAAIVLTAACVTCWGQDVSLESVGARFGASPTSNAHDYHEIDTFLNVNLPWRWDLGKEWFVQTRFDFSAGWMGWTEADTAVITMGPSFLFRREAVPVSFEGGSGPTILSRYDLISKNFGEPLQFTSYAGFNLDFGKHLRVGYRFQHMSNAGINERNPGLNLHMLKISYLF